MTPRSQRGTRGSWRLLTIVVMLGTIVGVGVGTGSPASGAVAQAERPVWCDWLPPELLPFVPECQGGSGGGGGGPIEDAYMAPGPWTATTMSANAPGTPGVMVVHPADLGADGYDHPIMTWGNGTGATCEATNDNGGLFDHLASWGYVVVCAKSDWTGSGAEILAAARWLVEQDANPSSPFHGNLDTDAVGASGGSQGASGAVNAMNQSDGLITSTVAVALTDPWVHIWGNPPNLGQVQQPLFMVSGTTDFLTTQEQQQTYYNEIPGPAAKAALVGVGHDTAGRERGYLTAWFEYTLRGDQDATAAFNGGSPEIAGNSAWTNWAGKGLP